MFVLDQILKTDLVLQFRTEELFLRVLDRVGVVVVSPLAGPVITEVSLHLLAELAGPGHVLTGRPRPDLHEDGLTGLGQHSHGLLVGTARHVLAVHLKPEGHYEMQ